MNKAKSILSHLCSIYVSEHFENYCLFCNLSPCCHGLIGRGAQSPDRPEDEERWEGWWGDQAVEEHITARRQQVSQRTLSLCRLCMIMGYQIKGTLVKLVEFYSALLML